MLGSDIVTAAAASWALAGPILCTLAGGHIARRARDEGRWERDELAPRLDYPGPGEFTVPPYNGTMPQEYPPGGQPTQPWAAPAFAPEQPARPHGRHEAPAPFPPRPRSAPRPPAPDKPWRGGYPEYDPNRNGWYTP